MVRRDHGMENFKVAQFMLHRGTGRGSIITGSSVHNFRVERAHRDVYSGVLCFFDRTFTRLEDNQLLDPLNERVQELHYIICMCIYYIICMLHYIICMCIY